MTLPRHGTSLVATTIVMSIASVAEADCECQQFRCSSSEGEFVFSPSQMLSDGAKRCINNQTDIFEANGECRHCDSDCKDNVCSCDEAAACEWYSYVAVALCYALALALVIYAARAGWKQWKEYKLRSYERRNLRTQRGKANTFDTRWECSIAMPLIVAGVLLIVGSIVLAARSFYLSSD
mmetsp:Transcript_60319/g.143695  ORF Transcript_60319/g.143695 Transcript_60319/m.143695 type:complete len:180 (+) Transcript_60319:84-623(+)